MDLLQQYWPLLLLATWFAFKWVRAKRVHHLLPSLRQQGAAFVDVRSVAEFSAGNAPNCSNIPLSELKTRLSEIPKGVPVVLCCASGTRSGMATAVLRSNGFSNVYNAGSWRNLL
jgi:phage shock protein E